MSVSRNLDFNYTIVPVNSTTYKMSTDFVNATSGKSLLSGTIWFLKNGTISALRTKSGIYYSGANASSIIPLVASYFSEFATAQGFVQDQSIYSNLFRSNGTSAATIGTNKQFTVTNYVADTLPENIQTCNGGVTHLTAYNLSVGTPSGSSLELATYAEMAGWTTTSGTNSTFDFTIQTTAFTVA